MHVAERIRTKQVIENNTTSKSINLNATQSNSEIQYLIITNNAMRTAFLPLANWKTKKGVLTSIKTVEDDIYGGFGGRDNAEDIREFIKWFYLANPNLKFVLLGGDVGIIPARLAVSADGGMQATDLYYASIDGNWNKNNNAIFGEVSPYYPCGTHCDDPDDGYPDLFVGRAPVNSILQVENFIRKVITYEKLNTDPLNSMMNNSYVNNVLLMNAFWNRSYENDPINNPLNRPSLDLDCTYPLNYNRTHYMPSNINSMLLSENPTCLAPSAFGSGYYKINYQGSPNLSCSPGNGLFSKVNVLNCLTGNTKYHIVYHWDHSTMNSMYISSQILNEYMTVFDLNFANTYYPPIFWAAGCQTNTFNLNCIAKDYMNVQNGGCLAYIGNSATSRSNDYYQFSNFSNSVYVNPSGYNLGVAFANSEILDKQKRKILNLLGDPEMPIWTCAPKTFANVNITPAVISSTNHNVRVSVTTSNLAGDVTVCITKDGATAGSYEVFVPVPKTIAASSTADFDFVIPSPATSGALTVTITAHNYLPKVITQQLIAGACTYSAIPFEINSSTAPPNKILEWQDDKIIYSDVKINTGFTLKIKSKIAFCSQSKLIVEKGAVLVIDGGRLYDACGEMWQGIEIQGNKNISQDIITNQGLVVIKNGGTIENALIAIRTIKTNSTGVADYSFTGGIIQADDAKFINNRTAIQLESYSYTNRSIIKNCRFETNQNRYQTPSEFIKMNDCMGVSITGNDFINTYSSTNHSDWGNGIVAYNTSCSIVGLISLSLPPTRPKPNNFTGLDYAISAASVNSLKNIIIKNNIFENNYKSMVIGYMNYAEIMSNIITTKFMGLQTYSFSNFKVEGNDFYSTNDSRGSCISASGANSSLFYRNTFHDLKYGIQVQRGNDAIENEGLQIKCNKFNDNSYFDIAITSGKIGNQGTCESFVKSTNNVFSNSSYSSFYTNAVYGVTAFDYNYFPDPNSHLHNTSTLVTPIQCTASGWSFDAACPSTLNGTGTGTATLIARISSVNSQLTPLTAKIDGGNTQALLTKINSNIAPGKLKDALLNSGKFLSDTVLIATIKKSNPIPPGILKDIIEPNSPVTTKVMVALNSINLPAGIKTDIQNYQTGTSGRLILEQQIASLQQTKSLATGDLMRYYLNDSIFKLDSAITFLKTQTSIDLKKQLAQAYLLKKDCSNATTIINALPQLTAEDIAFKQFYSIMATLCTQGKTVFDLTAQQKQQIYTLVNSPTSISASAKSVISMLDGVVYPLIVEDIILSDNQTLRGYLFNNSSCNNNPVANDTVILLDSAKHIVNLPSAVTTDLNGFFTFKFSELVSLNSQVKYTFGIKHGAVIQDTIFKTITQWISESPVNLNLRKLKAGFISDTIKCFADTAHFTNKTMYGIQPYTFYWNFGDGSPASSWSGSEEIGHKYNTPGTYSIKLKVTDALGCKDSIQHTLINPSPIIASFTADSIANKGATLNITNTSQGGNLMYVWYVNNVIYSSDINPVIIPPDTGIYTIQLIVTGANGCTSSTSQNVKINESTCAHAVALLPDTIPATVLYTMNNTEKWFRFQANTDYVNMLINDSSNTLTTIELYSGNCNSLVTERMFNVPELTVLSNGTRSAYLCNLSPNTDYYLKVSGLVNTKLQLSLIIKPETMAQVPVNGLVGYWPFNGNANDESGNNNNGTVYGATLVNDRLGHPNSAYNFNGINNFILINTQSSLRPAHLTFSSWVNFRSCPSWGVLFDNLSGDPWNGYEIEYASVLQQQIIFEFYTSVHSGVASNIILDLHKWYHFVVSYDGSLIKLYVNGVLGNTKSTTGDLTYTNIVNATIGSRINGSTAFYDGMIDDIRIYDHAISEQEINILYHEAENVSPCVNNTTARIHAPVTNDNTTSNSEANDNRMSTNNSEAFNNRTPINKEFVTLFPNPNDGNFYFNYSLPENGKCHFTVFDPTGKKVYDIEIKSGRNTIFINSNDFSNGIYYYQVLCGNRIVKTDKLVITK